VLLLNSTCLDACDDGTVLLDIELASGTVLLPTLSSVVYEAIPEGCSNDVDTVCGTLVLTLPVLFLVELGGLITPNPFR